MERIPEPAGGRVHRRFAVQAAGFAAMVAAALYWPVAFGKVPFPADTVLQFPPWESIRGSLPPIPAHAEQGDLATYFYPLRSFIAERLAGGELALWNPRILLGVPLFPNPLSAYFYPLSAFYLLFTVPAAWAISAFLQTALAIFFAALLARRIGATASGSLGAAAVFGLSAGLVVQRGYPEADTALWTPALFLAIELLRERVDRRSIALAAGIFALTALSGQLEMAALEFGACAVYVLVRLVQRDGAAVGRGGRRRFMAGFVAAAVLSFGLAAVQLVPAVLWSGEIGRVNVPPRHTAPLSDLRGLLARDLSANPNSWGIEVPAGAIYTGVLTLLLVPAAFAGRRRRAALPFGLLFLGSVELMYGLQPLIGVFRFAGQFSAQIRSLGPGYLISVFECSLAMLAGLGISTLEDELGGRSSQPARRPTAAFLAALATAGAVALALLLVPVPETATRGQRGLPGSWSVLAAGAVLLAGARVWRLPRRAFAPVAGLLLTADLLSAAYQYVPFVERRALYPPAPVYEFLAARQPSLFRVAHVDWTGPANVEMMYGLSSVAGYDFAPARSLEMLDGLGQVNATSVSLTAASIVASSDRRLDLFNVRYLVATTWNSGADTLAAHPDRFRPVFRDGSVRVFENRSVLPRAFLVDRAGMEILGDDAAALARLRDATFDPSRRVILARPLLATSASIAGRRRRLQGPGEVLFSSDAERTDGAELRVEAVAPSILVISQAFDPGWSASVDGEAVEVLRVDYGLTGLAIGPGSHRVRIEYSPRGLGAGAACTLVALVALAFLLGSGRSQGARRARVSVG